MLCFATQSKATHLIGGYMSYEFLNINSNNGEHRYKITFHVYRDCSGNVPLDDQITVGVYLNNDNNSLNQQPVFNLITKRIVQPPGSIECDYYRKNVCIEYGLYEGIISLKPYSEGYHITYTRCCRNIQNNIVQDGSTPSQGQTYYCFIPSTDLKNNSPAFYGVPSPYMCANDTNSFLFDAVDKDGDSLVYRFMRPFQGGSLASPDPSPSASLDTPLLRYKAGYTSLTPFGGSGYTYINSKTGYTELFSTETGNFVVGVEVLEYRDGNLLSKIRMDLQIIVLNCPANNTPTISSSKGRQFVIEAGEELCFNVRGQDPDGDQVSLSARSEVFTRAPGNKATFNGPVTGEPEVTYEFCWTPDCDAHRTRPYNVYFTAEDDGCPPKFDYLDVGITVLPFEGGNQLNGPTTVCDLSNHQYTLIDRKITSTFEWEVLQGKFLGDSTKSSVLVNWNSNLSGSSPRVRVREINEYGCYGDWVELDIDIQDSPPLPNIVGKDTVCKEDIGLSYTVNNNPGNTYSWFAVNATISTQMSNSIVLGSFNDPNFIIRVVETNPLGCVSDTADLLVYVIEPNPSVNGPSVVCPNAESIEYQVNGVIGSTYNWIITGGVQVSGGSSNTITVNWGEEGVGQVAVTEINKFGCLSNPVSINVSKTYDLIGESITGPTDVCEFEQLTPYQVNPINGSVFDWTVTGGLQSSGDSSSVIGVNWGNSGSGQVSVVQRAYDAVNDRWCVSTPVDIAVTIHPVPIADEILGITELCQFDDTVQYTINGFQNSTYEWAVDGSIDNLKGQGTNTIRVYWDQFGMFNLSVLETTNFGCEGELVDTLITIHPKPITSTITGPNPICPESASNHKYRVSGSNGSSYNWRVMGASNTPVSNNDNIIIDWDLTQNQGEISVVEISDQGCIGDTQQLIVPFDKLAIDLRFVSVGTPDDRMLIDWKLLNNSSTNSFDILKRSQGSAQWNTIVTVGGTTSQFLEEGINTDITSYEYQVSSKNKCGTTILSEIHTSILLSGNQDDDLNANLTFSDYLGWENGVSIYDLFLEDNLNSQSVIQPNVASNTSLISIHDPSQYKKCFRIKAEEDGGESTESWSNEICFFFSPTVYVPNAFTPNSDNLNDGFGVKGIAINQFTIKIYNRWGEKIYESNDINEKWTPQYQNKAIQDGTYLYLINYTDFENKSYQRTGTINLIR